MQYLKRRMSDFPWMHLQKIADSHQVVGPTGIDRDLKGRIAKYLGALLLMNYHGCWIFGVQFGSDMFLMLPIIVESNNWGIKHRLLSGRL